jgi:hypothetical protein
MKATAPGGRDTGPRWGQLGRFLDIYFRTAGSPGLDEIRPLLWPGAGGGLWDESSAEYRAAILEQ